MKRIPKFKLLTQPMEPESKTMKPFQWAGDDIGKRHQLGGDPVFIQGDKFPKCKSCGQKMTFYAQLDSINDDFQIADCGMIYVFVCFDCNETAAIIQSY